ncbi:zf-HC2 domain-containing protein [Streptomyces noursei]|uniref:zf-HC2 domain-containing protein n=1 Tax=Streptomyces noursei TaxID=1971 RepID=UPI0022A6EB0C|nr:zf-HC2 domain-containing protein [Streptomyces noursei]MCZ1013383.1 zf-HC2 domain-containing protein [Streptomyces noursei]
MSAEHDALRLALGGYVLSALPPAEMEQVRVHLAECAECRAEHTRLAGLSALLATVTEAEASGQTAPTADGDLADRLVARAAEDAQGPLPERPTAPAVSQVPERGCWRDCSSRPRPGAAGPGVCNWPALPPR